MWGRDPSSSLMENRYMPNTFAENKKNVLGNEYKMEYATRRIQKRDAENGAWNLENI